MGYMVPILGFPWFPRFRARVSLAEAPQANAARVSAMEADVVNRRIAPRTARLWCFRAWGFDAFRRRWVSDVRSRYGASCGEGRSGVHFRRLASVGTRALQNPKVRGYSDSAFRDEAVYKQIEKAPNSAPRHPRGP